MGAGPYLIIAGLVVEVAGAVVLVGRASWKHFRAFHLGYTATKKRIEDEAMAQAFNRLASGKREDDLADPLAMGFIATYRSSFWGLILIVVGLILQAVGTYLSYS